MQPSSEVNNINVVCDEGFWGGGIWTCTDDIEGNYSYKGKECLPVTYENFNSGSISTFDYIGQYGEIVSGTVDYTSVACDINNDGAVNGDDKFPDHSLIMVFNAFEWSLNETNHGNKIRIPIMHPNERNFKVDWGDGSCDIVTTDSTDEESWLEHTYNTPGLKVVRILGNMAQIGPDYPIGYKGWSRHLVNIINLGDLNWKSLNIPFSVPKT